MDKEYGELHAGAVQGLAEHGVKGNSFLLLLFKPCSKCGNQECSGGQLEVVQACSIYELGQGANMLGRAYIQGFMEEMGDAIFPDEPAVGGDHPVI